jgi:hypothetical protein
MAMSVPSLMAALVRRTALALAVATPAALVVAAPLAPAHALTLISEDEAKRPVSDAALLDLRGITRGPTITVVSPTDAATRSPVVLKVRFEPHGGSSVDVASVKVTYLKSPAVDLTARLKPYITAEGIALDQAVVAAGRHVVRIELKDAQGRQSSSIVKFSVER